MLWTTARQVPFAATDARPTCVPTCSLSTAVGATSVASATVSMKVRDSAKQMHPIKEKWWEEIETDLEHCVFLSDSSAGLLLPTSRPHGSEGGLLWETWVVSGILRVCSHPGLLQGDEGFGRNMGSDGGLSSAWRLWLFRTTLEG